MVGSETVSSRDGMNQVLVPGGRFTIGSTPGDVDKSMWLVEALGFESNELMFRDEQPARHISISDFWMDRHPVTVQQYCEFLNHSDAGECELSRWVTLRDEVQNRFAPPQLYVDAVGSYRSVKGSEVHPVTWVSWFGAVAYAQWVSKELPTEAQYERAARDGVTQVLFPWGDGPPPQGAGNLPDESARRKWRNWVVFKGYDDGFETTSPVCSFTPNSLGLYDLTGNVWEWCMDSYQHRWYREMPENEPVNLVPSRYRVLRGGSFGNYPWTLRTAARIYNQPNFRGCSGGFRCVSRA